MHLTVEYFNYYDTLTSPQVSLATAPPLHRWAQFGLLPFSAVMRVIGVLVWWISARPGGQIAYDDHLTRWLAGTTLGIGRVYACERTGVFASVRLCVLERVKWVWIAISSVSSFRRIYWQSIDTQTADIRQSPLDQIDSWHKPLKWFIA